MSVSIKNNMWTVEDTIDSSTYNKTLLTSGKYVDKNIVISLSNKIGNVEITNNGTLTQELKEKNGKYEITAVSTVNVIPIVTNGWVETVENKTFNDTNVITLNKTEIQSGLIPSSTEISGSSAYRFTATEGYNSSNLNKDIDVFQGQIEFGKDN